MKILMVGSGGREHTLTWHVAKNPKITEIFCAPGNPGMAAEDKVQCVDISATDIDGLAQFAKQEGIDLTIVGPEDPLAIGIVDRFEQEDLLIFGPNQAMARLESSKAYAKNCMKKWGIPTAPYDVCFNIDEAAIAINKRAPGMAVVKGDGLAAGKAVEISKSRKAAKDFAHELFIGKKYGKHAAVIIEDKLIGEEASIIAIVCGDKYLLLDSSQDHKPLLDDDKGPNTGGMGAYSPAPVVTSEIMERIKKKILNKLVNGMLKEFEGGYHGVIYLGLMITPNGPQVLEINVRLGDPECQALLMRLKTDLVEVFKEVAIGELVINKLEFDPRPCVVVALASRGYPEGKEVGVAINGWMTANLEPHTKVFHAGTRRTTDCQLVTNGGRVVYIAAIGSSFEYAIAKAYKAVEHIMFDGKQFRTDIGQKALKHSKQAQ